MSLRVEVILTAIVLNIQTAINLDSIRTAQPRTISLSCFRLEGEHQSRTASYFSTEKLPEKAIYRFKILLTQLGERLKVL